MKISTTTVSVSLLPNYSVTLTFILADKELANQIVRFLRKWRPLALEEVPRKEGDDGAINGIKLEPSEMKQAMDSSL